MELRIIIYNIIQSKFEKEIIGYPPEGIDLAGIRGKLHPNLSGGVKDEDIVKALSDLFREGKIKIVGLRRDHYTISL